MISSRPRYMSTVSTPVETLLNGSNEERPRKPEPGAGAAEHRRGVGDRLERAEQLDVTVRADSELVDKPFTDLPATGSVIGAVIATATCCSRTSPTRCTRATA